MSTVNSNYSNVTSNGVAGSTAGTQTASITAGASKDTFLKLLIAQIKHQDPLKPTDGTQFLAQLAQFSQLEQLMDIREQITALVTSATATPATNSENPGETESTNSGTTNNSNPPAGA